MKNIVKYGLVGVIGYMIGFYEYKYKVMEALLEAQLNEEKPKEEEAQQ